MEIASSQKKGTGRADAVFEPDILAVPRNVQSVHLTHPCSGIGAARPMPIPLANDLYLHFCVKCSAWGAFGYGVNFRLGRLGRWYCAAHRPQGATP
jgi:hypothetical protein